MSTPPPHCFPPSSSLPAVRKLGITTLDELSTALQNLRAIYCPLRLPAVLPRVKHLQRIKQVDSGYATEDEDEVTQHGELDVDNHLAFLRADAFEKAYAVRWLTGLIARASELPVNEQQGSDIIDEASAILASFTEFADDGDDDHTLARDFSFPTPCSSEPVNISLNDAPLSTTDHTDVGLQSWGASIVFSHLLCTSPQAYGLDQLRPNANIIELGAGTGLISLTLAKLAVFLPAGRFNITATDYHPAVLENMRSNIGMNFSAAFNSSIPVSSMLLDWSSPSSDLASTADMLFAADVVYAPEHARWLRDCAAHLLKPSGTFWLIVTVRSHGKFEGIPATAEAAFGEAVEARDGCVLRILEKTMLKKKRAIGRDDETGYMLFKIGWVSSSMVVE